MSPDPTPPATPAHASTTASAEIAQSLKLLALVGAVCALEALAIGAVLSIAAAHGWRLTAGLAAAIFGVMTLQPQIEAMAFGVVRPEFGLRIACMGLLISLVVAPLAVVVFWRVRRPRAAEPSSPHLESRLSTRHTPPWWPTILIGALAYVALYLLFGYFIAWRSAEVRAFYGGDASRSFFSHLGALQLRIPWFLPFQFLRGCLWGALALLILSMLAGSWSRRGLVLGLFFAVMMNAQLLLPNAMMPEPVRLIHIAETAPSNFLLGMLLAWLHFRPRRAFMSQ